MAVLAGVEEKRREVRGFAEFFDTANEDGVVTGQVRGFVGDFEAGAAGGKERHAAGTGLPRQAGEAVDGPGGEAVGQILLVSGEDVDRVVAGFAEGFEIVRAVVQTPEDQGRLQGNGGEGIDG